MYPEEPNTVTFTVAEHGDALESVSIASRVIALNLHRETKGRIYLTKAIKNDNLVSLHVAHNAAKMVMIHRFREELNELEAHLPGAISPIPTFRT